MVVICISLISNVEHLLTLSIFSGTCWPFVYLLWKNVCLIPLPIFNQIGGFFCGWVVWVFNIFWILTHYPICGLQIFSPILWIHFLFCWLFLLLCRSVLVDIAPLVDFCFRCLCFWCHIQKIIAKTNVSFFSMFSSRSFTISGLMWIA